MSTVRAMLMEQPGRLTLSEFKRPATGPDDGLLRVEMAGICGTDLKILHGKYAGNINYPLIPGHEIVGMVEEVGELASARWGVHVGDRVAVDAFIACGRCAACLSGNTRYCVEMGDYGVSMSAAKAPHLWGGFAELLYLAPGAQVFKLPDTCSDELGILVPAVISNALRWTDDIGQVSVGSSVLIQGPGPIGLACVAVARALGAAKVIVTGLPEDTGRMAMAHEIGADHCLLADPNLEREVLALTGGQGVDVVIDLSGAVQAIALTPLLVRRLGTIVLAGLSGGRSSEIPGDIVALKEITIKGVFSRESASVRRAMKFVEQMPGLFDDFVTHRHGLRDTVKAIEVVGSGDPSLIKSVVLPLA